MATVSVAALLVLISCCCSSFVSSGILPGSVRGYQYSRSYTSRQSQSYDPDTGAYSSVTVTSRQCNVIRRITQYETVRVPFMCQTISGRVAPLPPHMDSKKVQILSAMEAGGWSMCYQSLPVPVYRYHRIPVCCPGTTPTPDGGCLSRKTVVVPSPGQLLQSNTKIYNGHPGQEARLSSHSAYHYIPATPTPMVVQPPRPYGSILSRVSSNGLTPNSLIRQVILSGTRGGPTYRTETERGTNTMLPPQFHPPMSRGPGGNGGGMTEWHSDIARYLAAMMYQKLLVEQQQKILQDEINRQLRLRQQMEFIITQQTLAQLQQQHRQKQQHQQQQQQQQGRRHPAFFPQIPTNNRQPNPIPSPPVTVNYTEYVAPTAEEEKQPITTAPEIVQTGGGVQREGEGPVWKGGILDDMDHQGASGSTDKPPMFGNGPANIPPGTQTMPRGVTEMKDKVKGIVDSCLTSSGITKSMESILKSGDLDQLRPVCRAGETVGPCVMRTVNEQLGQDQMGMIGRHMMQSILVSLGQLCSRLENADKMAGTPNGDITSPPVFPNPAPSMTRAEVTEGTVENTNQGDSSPAATDNNNNYNNEPAIHSVRDSPRLMSKPPATEQKQSAEGPNSEFASLDDPAATPSSAAVHAQAYAQTGKDKTKVKVVEAAFPMWMILSMVGACAALLLFGCLTICLVLRCRHKKKTVDLQREPEKLPVPAEGNIYAASPCVPPPAYATTAVKQTMGGEEEEVEDPEFKIPEDSESKMAEKGTAPDVSDDEAKETEERA